MRAYELEELLSVRMKEKGYGGKEITVTRGEGHEAIEDILFCQDCQEFHIVTNR